MEASVSFTSQRLNAEMDDACLAALRSRSTYVDLLLVPGCERFLGLVLGLTRARAQ